MIFSLSACATDKGKNDVVDDKANKGTDVTGNNNVAGTGENKTLEGTAKGYGGDVNVTVEVNGKSIVSVVAVGKDETQGIGSKAIDELPAKIVEANSTDIDGVSGATYTSNAIKEAVKKALEGNK